MLLRYRRTLRVVLRTVVGHVVVVVNIIWAWCRGGRNVAVFSGGHDAPEALSVENKHGRTSLESWVSSLALPVSVAGFAERNVAVGIFDAERMFLATVDVVGPVAGVGVFVVEETTNAELLRGSSVPAGPVPRAGRLVAEDAVEPVTVLCADWAV